MRTKLSFEVHHEQVSAAPAGTLVGCILQHDDLRTRPSYYHAGGVLVRAADGFGNCVAFTARVRVLSSSVTVRVGYSPSIYAHGALYRVTVAQINAITLSGVAGAAAERATKGNVFIVRFTVARGCWAFLLPHPSPMCHFIAYENNRPAIMGGVIAVETGLLM